MSEQEQHPLTFEAAERINAYTLARMWADGFRLPPPMDPVKAKAAGLQIRTTDHELEDLAIMSALRTWLDRWTGNGIHKALRAGATVEQVAAAAGLTTAETAQRWRKYDAGQRHLWPAYPDMDRSAEHDQVAAVVDAAEPRDPEVRDARP